MGKITPTVNTAPGIAWSGLPWPEIITVILIFVLPPFFFPKQALLISGITLFISFGRSNLFYHKLDAEVQSLLALIMGMLYGPWVVLFIAIFSTPLQFKLSVLIGLPDPLLAILDGFFVLYAGLVGTMLVFGQIYPWGLIALVAMDIVRNNIKRFMFHEHITVYVIMTSFFTIVTYLIMANFLEVLVAFLGGAGF